jgi:hypothetical protein
MSKKFLASTCEECIYFIDLPYPRITGDGKCIRYPPDKDDIFINKKNPACGEYSCKE